MPGSGPLLQQCTDRFALVNSEGRDVDQTNDVRRVAAERGHDLSAVRVAGDDGRAIPKAEHVAQSCDVVRERGLWKLGGELEIFKHLASGDSNGEIARKLTLSTNTVANHIASILAKLHLEKPHSSGRPGSTHRHLLTATTDPRRNCKARRRTDTRVRDPKT